MKEIRVEHRDPTAWRGPVLWVVFFGLWWLLWHGTDASPLPTTVWLIGNALIVTRMVMTIVRTSRGITLCADGIVWHRYELFVPWSNVAEVSASPDGRLLVKAVDPEQAIDDVWLGGKVKIKASLRRCGTIFTLDGRFLSLSTNGIVAECTRLRAEYDEKGGFSAFGGNPPWPVRRRAARRARIWAAVGPAGVLVLLLTVFLPAPSHARTQHSAGLAFRFQRMSRPGYVDQVLSIKNPGPTAIAPTLGLVPLDRNGRPMPGVTVRTAFGSERGQVVVPPHDTVYDILAFDGPGYRDVTDVRAVVRAKVPLDSPTSPMTEPIAQPIDTQGKLAMPRARFAVVSVHNLNRFPASVRMVCLTWERTPVGIPRQMVAALPIGDLTPVDSFSGAIVPVMDHSMSCDDIKAYLSR